MKKSVILLLPVLLIGMIYWWKSPPTVQGPSSDYEFEYIIRISGNGGPSDTLPMIIALHGQGDTPENFFNTLLKDFDYPARFIVVKGPIGYPGPSAGSSGWPMKSSGLPECGDALTEAVSVLLERYPTKGRPIVLGFSSGAFIAYYLATFHAEQFSYIFPISGGLPMSLISDKIVFNDNGAKIIAFHGNSDQVIGFNQGKTTVHNLRQRGFPAELIAFNGGHIDIFLSANHILMNQLGLAINDLAH